MGNENSVIMGSANASSVVMKIGAKAEFYMLAQYHAMPIQESGIIMAHNLGKLLGDDVKKRRC